MKRQSVLALAFALLSLDALAQSGNANLEAVKSEILSEVALNCKAGSEIKGVESAFSINAAGNLVVEFGRFECPWEFNNHFFCGARACEVREYRLDGAAPSLLKTYLR